jgi:translation elongation factor EF-4
MEEQFINFLKDHKAKLAFEANLKEARGITLKKYLDRFNYRKGAKRLIAHAFRFIDTPEGRDYWLELSTEWYKDVRA